MNIFLDTLSPLATFVLFDDDKKVVDIYSCDIKGNESTKLISEFDTFLQKYALSYSDIKHLVVMRGPGSFTGTRITILMANTIAYTTKCVLVPLTYFQVFPGYPIIKVSSKRDVFAQFGPDMPVEIVSNEELLGRLAGVKKVYGDVQLDGIEVVSTIDYKNLLANIDLTGYDMLEPYYIKKPNIS